MKRGVYKYGGNDVEDDEDDDVVDLGIANEVKGEISKRPLGR